MSTTEQKMKTLFKAIGISYTNNGASLQMRCLCGAIVNKTGAKRHTYSETHKRYIQQNPDIEAQREAEDLESLRTDAARLGLNPDDEVNELRRHEERLRAEYTRKVSEIQDLDNEGNRQLFI
jgi:hypothetical protein